MGRFVKGDIVVAPFPFADLTASNSIPIARSDLVSGSLRVDSNARPNRLFTADSNIILYKAAALDPARLQQVTDRIVEILRS